MALPIAVGTKMFAKQSRNLRKESRKQRTNLRPKSYTA